MRQPHRMIISTLHSSSMLPGYQPPRWAPPRKHGLQLPLSRDQLGAMIIYPLLTLVRVCALAARRGDDMEEIGCSKWSTSGIILSARILYTWLYSSLTDPSLFSSLFRNPRPSTSSPPSTSQTPIFPWSLVFTPLSSFFPSSAGAIFL